MVGFDDGISDPSLDGALELYTFIVGLDDTLGIDDGALDNSLDGTFE